MLSAIIWILFIIGFLVGLKRGLILQLIHLTGFLIAFLAAAKYYKEFAETVKLWIPYPSMDGNEALQVILSASNAEAAYYNAIAFFIIFFAVKILLQIVGSMLDFLARIPVISQLNRLGGGILGFLEVYLVTFVLLYVASLVPVEQLQSALDQSGVAKFIIGHTPFLTKQVSDFFLGAIIR
ncbi:MAG: CvpA family protein [Caldibacillus debilis]|jgi:uncharacterized membrane protein required for colicin V production|uniref:CvpA family protein n=1 Tax=Caldibacillus debilis TaxID=301148 RepID=A0A150MAF1_9BACI|nr:CvpA family protein [Caldibacillus debilis]MBO2481963.1 hypothetical protein [Bacillaceae bacterium]KYD21421.1 hypothetical protein B4135_1650 [Caldibacillus debilis]MBY6270998.1 hypothetical protein [Bacillaceae bacterium]OUM90952.1 MAG: hypothetical protein BAA03_11605 [Caldibacillus debilis]REJ13346.1 MAG: CvpA family protein [Caldibacillus debilis]